MPRVSTYICGDAGSSDEFNPFKVTRQEHAPEILFLLNLEPLSESELSGKLAVEVKTVSKVLEDLSRINAVVEKGGKWYVLFPIFTKRDVHLIAEKTRKPAMKLAEEVMRKESGVKGQLAKLSCARQVEMNKIMFAVIGCFILDWKGLEVLNNRGLSGVKQQPGDRKYVLLGREKGAGEGLYDKMYWGSHSNRVGGITFTSFGDHTGCRYVFPDLAWNLSIPQRTDEKVLPDWFRAKITEASNIFQTYSMLELGRLLLLLNDEGPMDASRLLEKLGEEREQADNLLKLLVDMKYVSLMEGEARLNYPFFDEEDKAVIEAVWGTLSESVEKEACDYFNSLQTELAEITPIRRGIDPREIYTDIWHWVFGGANRIMAEKGFFFDPPKEREGEGRYIAWIKKE